MTLTIALTICGIAVAMGLLGLSVLLRRRARLKRPCALVGESSDDRSCGQCGCDAGENAGFDS